MREEDIEVISEFLDNECGVTGLHYFFDDYDVDSYIHEVSITNGDKNKVLYFKVGSNEDVLLNLYDDVWSEMSIDNVRDFWIMVAPSMWPAYD